MPDVQAIIRGWDPDRPYQIGEIKAVRRSLSQDWGKKNVAKKFCRLLIQNAPSVDAVLAFTESWSDAFTFAPTNGGGASVQRIEITAVANLGSDMSAAKRAEFSSKISRKKGLQCDFVSQSDQGQTAEFVFAVDAESYDNEPEQTIQDLKNSIDEISNDRVANSASKTLSRWYLSQEYVEGDLLTGLIPGSEAVVTRDWSALTFIDRLKE